MTGADLRASILQAAVQGKLVPQDKNDEPASVLLERIRAERAELVKQKKIRAPKGGESVITRYEDGTVWEQRGKNVAVEITDEIPFDIPDGWEWARLGLFFSKMGSGSTPRGGRKVYKDSGVKFIRSQNVYNDGLRLDTVAFISEDVYASRRNSHVMPRDLLLNITGASIGRCAVVPEEFDNGDVNQHVMILRPIDDALNEYIHLAICSSVIQNQIMDIQVGSTKEGLSATRAVGLLVPIPPLTEQQRIVAKIDELMPLVERYDKLDRERTSLNAAIAGDMRASILQAAVQGALTEREPTDEPASKLLEHIREERRELVKQKKIRASRGGESVITRYEDGTVWEQRGKGKAVEITDEIPFDIPDGWEWARLEMIVIPNTGLGYKKENLSRKTDDMVRVLRGGNITLDNHLTFKDNDVMISREYVDDTLLLKTGMLISPSVTSIENVGKVALIENDYSDVVCGGFVFYFTPCWQNDVFSRHLYLYFASPAYRDFARANVKKSGQAFYNLGKTVLATALIPIPPLAEQQHIVAKLDEVLPRVERLGEIAS